jgi:predicted membrane protein
MENVNVKTDGGRSNRVWSGLFLLVIGIIFFLRNLGIYIPDWLFSWHVFLIFLGLFIGFKRNFHGGGWLAMVLVGSYFTLESLSGPGWTKYYFATVLAALGLYLILTPKKAREKKKDRKQRAESMPSLVEGQLTSPPESTVPPGELPDEVIDSINVFGGTRRNVFSKNLKGGDIVAIFGGCDLNLTQADFQGTITLDITAICGGVKIIIPPTWSIKSELVAIFGGVEDKTSIIPYQGDHNKCIILKGVALFGGVDIRNF